MSNAPIIGAQNLILGSQLKATGRALDPDLAQIWTFDADKLRVSGDAVGASSVPSKAQMEAHVLSAVNTAVSGRLRFPNAKYATAAALPGTYTVTGGVLTATGGFGGITFDGASPSVGDLALVKNESGGNTPYNGLYTVTVVGDGSTPYVLTRATFADSAEDLLEGSYVWVTHGTVNADTMWYLTQGPVTVDTDDITWSSMGSTSYSADGDGITETGGVFHLELDGGSLVKGASGLKVNTAGIGVTQLGIRPFQQTIVGNSANGATLTLSQSVLSGMEAGTTVHEDGALLAYVSSSPDNDPVKEFSVSGSTVTLGFTQIDSARYTVIGWMSA